MAVAALMMAAVPSLFSAAFPGLELKAAARQTMSSLRLARETAIRTGADTALVVDVEERRLDLQGFKPVRLPKRLEMKLDAASREMIDDQRGVIRFFPDGSSTGGRVMMARGQAGYQVGVNWLTGRILMAPWKAP